MGIKDLFTLYEQLFLRLNLLIQLYIKARGYPKVKSFVFNNFLPLNIHRKVVEIQIPICDRVILNFYKELINLLFGHPLLILLESG